MATDRDTLSGFSGLTLWLASIWREGGVLLLTVSLFLLPWFRDLYPPVGRNPVITGVEFLKYGAWPVILAYIAVWLSYGISRFLNQKWASIIFLVVAYLLYLYITLAYSVFGSRFDPLGIPLGRGHGYNDVNSPAMVGVWVNWLGLITLTLGLYLAEKGRGRTALIFAGVGALLGFGLLVGSILLQLSLPDAVLSLGFLPAATWYGVLAWVQMLGLPIGGAVLGIWIALRGEPKPKPD